MIVDRLEKWGLYFSGAEWLSAFDFLVSLGAETPEGEYPIMGDKIFARVMSYETRTVADCSLEAHHEYIDLQAVLIGAEGIAWHPVENLLICDSYDPVKDVEFYLPPKTFPVKVDVTPGLFVALFPNDAHMPQLQVDTMPHWVKKVVVKVHVSLHPQLRG